MDVSTLLASTASASVMIAYAAAKRPPPSGRTQRLRIELRYLIAFYVLTRGDEPKSQRLLAAARAGKTNEPTHPAHTAGNTLDATE